MQYRNLGNTDAQTSVICLGTELLSNVAYGESSGHLFLISILSNNAIDKLNTFARGQVRLFTRDPQGVGPFINS